MIDQSTVTRIFDASEISDVVSDFVTLKKRGVNYLGLCPFHNEKTPSFTVSPAKGIYKCFGCGKGGNSVNFIMEHEHLDYVGALKYLAKKYHIDVVEQELSPEQEKQKNDRESMMIVNSFAQKSFSHNLYQHQQGMAVGMSYLRERGFRDDIIKKFELGFCLEDWEAFSKQATNSGYKREYLVKTGLSIDKENRLLDRFRGRVIFPIHGIAGRVLAFGGRILKNDKKAAKYLNSPESEVYHKSRVLYGIFQAKKSIVQNDKCFLVEGYTDVLSFHQAGIENVVASSGTALTPDQIRLIKRFTNNVTIIYDGDTAGIKASLRGIDLILEQEVNAKVLLLPEGEDPDSFSRTMGASDLIDYIDRNESDFILFKAKLLLDDAKGDPVKRANLIVDILRSIEKMSPPTRPPYIKECSRILNVDERTLYSELNKTEKKRRESGTVAEIKELGSFEKSRIKDLANACDTEERALVSLLLNFDSEVLFKETDENGQELITKVGSFIISELQKDELESVDPLYKLVFDLYGSNMDKESFNAKTFFRDHSNEKVSQLAADILSEPYEESKIWSKNGSYVESILEKLKDLVPKMVNEYKGKKVRILMKEVLQEMQKAQETGDSAKMMELMQQKMVLDQIKNAISKELGNRTIL
ncbi:DNA primase [Marinifilum sp. N1E240]|uniref:DNA primase n=1 Tax=Marinifilum sp. N1E240 TaxID=2608082 RepID=UPI00128B2B2B|nr:DNA primase [Marinifilum sp. N1E240]MPQ48449.1 DNA primase [Marinifilum sp. N1E240]